MATNQTKHLKPLMFSYFLLFATLLNAQTRNWATYYGGTSSEQITAICTTLDSAVYITGFTSSNDNVATTGAHQETRNGASQDGLMAKFSANGTRLWGTYFGGVGLERVSAIATFKNGDVVIGGYTNSTSNIATVGAYQTNLLGSFDAFLAKFSANGTLLWATYIGGASSEEIEGITIDPLTEDIIVVGTTASDSIGNKFTNVHKNSLTGLTDIFISKFTSNGAIKWLSYYGGSLNDYATRICTDNSGNLYISGNSFSISEIATAKAFKLVHGNTLSDAIFTIFSRDGQLKYGTYYGSEVGTDFFNAIASDNAGSVYLVGYGNSADSIATPTAQQTTFGGGSSDAYLIKFDTAGNRIWGTYVGAAQNDYLYGVTTGPDGKVYVAGHTNSSPFPVSTDAFQQTYGGGNDGVIGAFSPAGNKLWLSYYGGTQLDQLFDVSFNANNQIVACGYTTSSSVASPGAHQTTIGGSSDAFFINFSTGTSIAIDSSIKNNLIGSNQFLCGSKLPNAILGQLPSGGNGSYSYLWLQSTSSASGPFSPASGLNTSQNYSPGLPTASTWYKRIVFSGTQNTESNVVQISNGGSLKAGFTVNSLIQCERDNFFTFSDTTTVPDITIRRWDFGDGNIGSNVIENYTYTFGTVNYFNVKIYLESAGGCIDSTTRTVYLIPNPQPNTIIGDTSVKRLDRETYTVPANTGYQYNWWLKRGLGTINKLGNNVEVAWTKSWGTDTLYCQEQTGGGCYGDTLMLIVNISPASGEDELKIDGLTIFPNPVREYFQVALSSQEEVEYSIQNMFGIECQKGTIQPNENILLEHLSVGTYLLIIKDSEGNSAKAKFIKVD